MGILLKQVRIYGFRGLENIEIDFETNTILVGSNNSGKTTLLKALQLALSNSLSISIDDFFYCEERISNQIIIDVLMIPVDGDFSQIDEFEDDWHSVITTDRITITDEGKHILSFRTIIEEDLSKKTSRKRQYIIDEWAKFEEGGISWYENEYDKDLNFYFDEIPFFYIDANRDILEDIKSKTSYFGRLLSTIEYNSADKIAIEELIKELNRRTIESSDVLSNIETTLLELDTAMDNPENTVSLTPFTKKLKDLNKGVNITYSEFSMDYHGMGTRSWSSLLVLKSFLQYYKKKFEASGKMYFPIIAVEEPESHLHPNAQKKLYSQIKAIPGQKIISTHSSYIAASAELKEIRSLSKNSSEVAVGKIDENNFTTEEIRKINRQVVNTRGELFFSKAIILCEGETEEQTLPLLIKKYFGKDVIELGIDVVGIGGGGNYFPFINFAEKLGINWYILSDGEEPILKKLKKDLKKLSGIADEISLNNYKNICFFENGDDFENYLLRCGFQDEIETCLNELLEGVLEKQIIKKNGTPKGRVKTDVICDTCKQNIFEDEIRNYDGDEGRLKALNDILSDNKTKYPPILSELIYASQKAMPAKIIELFKEISKMLKPIADE
jgi:putative ATP-dependent endonuclease of OLD family